MQTMNKISVIAFALLTAVSTASAQTPAPAPSRIAFYAEPSVIVAFGGDFDTAAGGALALGLSLNNAHSLEAQVIRYKTEAGYADFTFMPVLATYKYRLPLPHKKLSIKLGGSIGATRLRAESHYGWGEETQTAFTVGAVGGLSYALTERVSLEGNVLVLGLDDTNLTTSGRIQIVTAGVNFRF
jgi:opacity protein-like surface antigen